MPVGCENMFELTNIGEGFAGNKLAGAVDRLAAFLFTPHSHSIEILECEARRIEPAVA